jgi:Protein NO VEIN, C-terminal
MRRRSRPVVRNGETSQIQRALRRPWEHLQHQSTASSAEVRIQELHRLEDAGRNEDRVRQEYTGRYPMELLQNAHDACADARHVGSVHFVVTDSALLTANEGVAFTADRITSLIRHGSSEKALDRGSRATIGYKGVGFDAVFEICDRPQVISQTARFGFDGSRARTAILEALGETPAAVPIRYFPFLLDEAEWQEDRGAVEALLASGAVTVIRLPFRRGLKAHRVRQDLEESLPPEVLLFADAVDTLEIRSQSLTVQWQRTSGRRVGVGRLVHLHSESGGSRSWLVAKSTVPLPRALRDELRDPLWTRVPRVSVATALPWKKGRGIDAKAPPLPVHVYFPTEDELGRALLVHGDFYVSSNRRRIETRGSGGRVSELVAQGAVRLAARLAQSVTDQGYPLLRALAVTGAVDGFGGTLGTLLEDALGQARIARPADGSRARRPRDLARLSTRLPVHQERELALLLRWPGEVVMPGDDLDKAGELLSALAAETLPPDKIADRLAPAESGIGYEEALGTIGRWHDSLDWLASSQAERALRGRPIVQDITGRWVSPSQVVRRVEGGPSLPPRLQRPELRPPRGQYARTLIDKLKIDPLTPDRALSILLDALERGNFGASSNDEAREAFGFIVALWEGHRPVLQRAADRLGVVPVPVRTAKGRSIRWREAGATYFSRPWTRNRVLQDAYGPLGEAEFLAEPPPTSPGAQRSRRQLFEQLSVASAPRWIRHSFTWGSPLRQLAQWRRLEATRDAFQCPDGHPQTPRRVVLEVVDRLDELVDRAQERDEGALARLLLALEDPYGPDGSVSCQHSSHRSGRGRTAPGYQRWLLETRSWVPVAEDPAGKSSRRPLEAWIDVTKAASWLLVPRAAFRSKQGRHLRITTAERPQVEAVESAISELAALYPDLGQAPVGAIRSAAWLQERLERVLGQRRSLTKRARIPFAARSGGEWQWSQNPLVQDLPGVDAVPTLVILPPGRWDGVRRAYGLGAASDVVTVEVEAVEAPGRRGILGIARRAELVAVLAKRGVELGSLAYRLGRLRELPCRLLRLRLSSNGQDHDLERPFYLRPHNDRLGRLSSGILYLDAGAEPDAYALDLARSLAGYLGDASLEEPIGLFLIAPHGSLLRDRRVSEEDVLEAEEAIRRHRSPEGDQDEASSERQEPPPEERESGKGGPHGGEVEVDHTGGGETHPSERPAPKSATDDTAGQTKRTEDTKPEVAEGGQRQSWDGPTHDRDERLVDPTKISFGETTAGTLHQSARKTSGSPGGSAGSGDPLSDKEVELVAVEVAREYGRRVLGAEVTDVERYRRGWDLEFLLPDGREELVEVKGSARQGRFILTRNELRAARSHNNWVLLYVTNLIRGLETKILRFADLGAELPDEALDALAWDVTWSAVTHNVIEVLPP